jgi:hypothetical protein
MASNLAAVTIAVVTPLVLMSRPPLMNLSQSG